MKVPVLTREGNNTGREVELPDEIFNLEPNEHVLWLAAKVYQSNMRQGTHAHKTRSMVAGGGKKPFKQKGTGRARQGTTRAPHMRGGGTVFGPTPHSYRLELPLKVRRLAKKCALSVKNREQSMIVVEDFAMSTPKTKEVAQWFEKLVPAKREKTEAVKTAILLTKNYDPNLRSAIRNHPRLRVEEATVASAFDIIHSRFVILQEGAVAPLAEVLRRV